MLHKVFYVWVDANQQNLNSNRNINPVIINVGKLKYFLQSSKEDINQIVNDKQKAGKLQKVAAVNCISRHCANKTPSNSIKISKNNRNLNPVICFSEKKLVILFCIILPYINV